MTNAVFTLLFSPSYLPGALVLAASLRSELDPGTTLGVLVDEERFDDGQLAVLQKIFDEVVRVNRLELTQTDKLWGELQRPELAATFSKVWLWLLTRFDKVLYLDADTLPVPLTTGSVVDLLNVNVPEHLVAAAPDAGFPDVFNSGVMLLRPNMHDFAQLVAATHLPLLSFDGADQGLLNQYFNPQPDWVAGGDRSRWVQVPFVYNCTPLAQYQYAPALSYVQSAKVPVLTALPVPLSQLNDNPDGGAHLQLDHYHLTALTYINQTSGVKLLHFIGPNKPWFNRDAPVFAPWWNAWRRNFGDKSVHEVSASDVQQVAEEPKEVLEAVVSGDNGTSYYQSYLVDPHLYQSIGAAGEETRSWDPSREAPTPEPAFANSQDYSQLESGMKMFQNEWDRDPAIDQVEEDYAELDDMRHSEPVFEPVVYDPPAPSGALAYHYVVPERVFEGSDYFPVHRLPKPNENDAKNDDVLMEEIIDENDADDEVDLEVAEDERDTNLEAQSLGKRSVFPWEKRSTVERVWE